ncbi:glutamate ABC transporter substrate-binding protein [Lysinibacter cavernae]|uniref:Glutamate transport system substrate-binding protein n=1 Tax=Lysinibacter cavernae TaxID=1640652 RepID=A0A7X5R0K5_9MICO|nr:glutamate ABC transporter substrate-binding protein [Lysinibacter cavernae]NIH53386.1 glutamate transport system substrate-binding protein [Lysinibacter cavernae]
MLKKALVVGVGLVAALTLSACGGSSDPASTDGADSGSSDALFEVATDFTLEGSPTFDAIDKRGKVIIGVKEDQPGLGFLDAATGERTGFDIEIARWVAASIGYDEADIEFKAIPSANRESAIVNGDIDYYVGTYSITDKRKEQIDFAGPYFVTGQGLLVAKDNTDIKSEDDLAGKTVCSATGSTPIQNIKENFPDTKTEEFETYSQCVEALLDGSVDAVTTDQAILLGYASQQPDELKVVGEPFTVENYGVGIQKGDDVFRTHVNELFTDGGDTWQAIYDATLGQSGSKVTQPEVDAY